MQPKVGSTAAGLFLLSGLLLVWQRQQLARHEIIMCMGALVFPLSTLFSVLFAGDDLREAFGHWGRHLTLAFIIPAYLTSVRFRLDSDFTLFVSGVVAAFCMFAWSIYDLYFLSLYRGSAGGAMNPIFFGSFSAAVVVLLVASIQVEDIFNWHNLLIFLAVFAALFACWASISRSAWFGLFMALTMSTFLTSDIRVKKLCLHFLTIVILAITVGLFFEQTWAWPIKRVYAETMVFFTDPSQISSMGARINMWRNAVLMVSDQLLVGVGLSGYYEAARHIVESGQSYLNHPVLFQHTAHSIYFHTLAVSGIVGLAGLLSMFLLLGYSAYTAPVTGRTKWGALALVVLFAAIGVGTTWTEKSHSVSLFAVLFVLLMSRCRHHADNDS